MHPTLKKKLLEFYTEEQIRLMELMEFLGFHASSIDPRIFKNVTLDQIKNMIQPHIEWMAIDNYKILKDIRYKMDIENKEPVHPLEFVAAIYHLPKIEGVRVCIFELDGQWGNLVAIEGIQRSICSIMSGDGFGSNCLFAVKTKTP